VPRLSLSPGATTMTLDAIKLTSSSLVMAHYDPEQGRLRLQFRDGAHYQYFDVPRDIVNQLLSAPSKGYFFNRFIRGRFEHAKIADEN
jgi:lysyl-tRNA synthetase, class II